MAVLMDQYLRRFKTGGLFCPGINIKKYQEFSTDLKKTEQKKDLKLFRLRYNAVSPFSSLGYWKFLPLCAHSINIRNNIRYIQQFSSRRVVGRGVDFGPHLS